MTSHFDQQEKRLEESKEKSRNNQHFAGLHLQAQQPRLAAKADVKLASKTRESKNDFATYERCGDVSSVKLEDPIGQTSFGDKEFIEPSTLHPICSDDGLVDEGAEVQQPCLSPAEMRTSTPVDVILHAGSALTKCRDDALINEDAEALKPRLSLVNMRTSTPSGGLLRAGSASTYNGHGTNFLP